MYTPKEGKLILSELALQAMISHSFRHTKNPLICPYKKDIVLFYSLGEKFTFKPSSSCKWYSSLSFWALLSALDLCVREKGTERQKKR